MLSFHGFSHISIPMIHFSFILPLTFMKILAAEYLHKYWKTCLTPFYVNKTPDNLQNLAKFLTLQGKFSSTTFTYQFVCLYLLQPGRIFGKGLVVACDFYFVYLKKIYCYSVTVVCLFFPSLHPTPAEPPSLPHLHPPPGFRPCVLYSSSCNPLSSLSPPHSPPGYC